jgi:GAF domain-containing protein
VVNLSVSSVGGVSGASVTLIVDDHGHLKTSNASSPEFREIDEGQYLDGLGPCVEAIRTGAETRVSLPVPQWPIFSERAQLGGVTSVFSLPLQVRDETTGALNLYSIGGDSLSEEATEVARSLAGHAAVVLANAATLANSELIRQHLEEALTSRDLIGQAKGILMARETITADEAFDVLRRASQRSNRKLRDIAEELVSNQDSPPRDLG